MDEMCRCVSSDNKYFSNGKGVKLMQEKGSDLPVGGTIEIVNQPG